jgi:hypothetical protein
LIAMSSNLPHQAAPTLFGPSQPPLSLPQVGDTSREWCQPQRRPRSSSRSPQFEPRRRPLVRVSERCPRREVIRARRPGPPLRALAQSIRQGTPELPWGRSASPHTPVIRLEQLEVSSLVCSCALRSSRHRHRRRRRCAHPSRSLGPLSRVGSRYRRTSRGVRPSCPPTDRATLKAVR